MIPKRAPARTAGLVVLLLLACERVERGPEGTADATTMNSDAQVAANATDSLFALGLEQYAAWEMDSARASFTAAAEHATQAGSVAAEARAVTRLGLVAWRLGEYADARRLGDSALDLKLRHDLRDQLFDSYNALGLLAWLSESRYHDALELFRRAEELAEQAADTVSLAKVWSNLGNIHTDLGEFAEARRLFPGALDAARRVENAMIEGRVLTNLGMLAVRTGDPASAVEHLELAIARSRAAEDPVGMQAGVAHLGTAYAALGQLGRAIAYLDSALVDARTSGHRQEEASNLGQLAELHRQAGDLPGALRLLGESRTINAELDLLDELGADLRMEAQLHAAAGNFRPAYRAATEALEIHQRLGARLEILGDLLMLAELSHATDGAREAAAYLREAMELASTLGARAARASVALTTARIADREEDAAATLQALRRADADLLTAGPETEWEAHALAARAFRRTGALDSAVAAGRRAVDVIESVRGQLGSSLLRTSYAFERAEPYRDLVTALLLQDRSEEAFEVADGWRGRALLEHVAARRATADANGGSSLRQLAEAERQILRTIDTLIVRIAEARASSDAVGVTAQRSELDRLYEELEVKRGAYSTALVRAEERRSADPAMLGGRRPTGADVRAALRADEILLHYTVMPDRVLVFVLRPETVRVAVTEVAQNQLAAQVRVARELLGRPGTGADGAIEALYDLVVRPAVVSDDLENVRTLLIVSDGELTYLPFAALRDRSDGRYLAEKLAILHLPSAGALPMLRDRARAGEASAPPAAFAPHPDDLPATSREVGAFSAALPGASVVSGDDASEARFREALSRAPIVHAATHGVLNARSPLFSRLELAPGRGRGSENDGRFEIHELLDVSVTASLVFLSGCETGAGAAWATGFSRGEDYATLARAFLYAGAENVVATLWRVEDEGAAQFASVFYRELSAARSPLGREMWDMAEVLVGAQRAMLSHPRYHAPYYWAGYRLSGGGAIRPLPVATGRRATQSQDSGGRSVL